MTNRSIYTVYTVGVTRERVIVVLDNWFDGCDKLTVTNDAERVVTDLQLDGTLSLGPPLIYRDTEGMFDALKYDKNGFVDFVAIQTKNEQVAVVTALEFKRAGRL